MPQDSPKLGRKTRLESTCCPQNTPQVGQKSLTDAERTTMVANKINKQCFARFPYEAGYFTIFDVSFVRMQGDSLSDQDASASSMFAGASSCSRCDSEGASATPAAACFLAAGLERALYGVSECSRANLGKINIYPPQLRMVSITNTPLPWVRGVPPRSL